MTETIETAAVALPPKTPVVTVKNVVEGDKLKRDIAYSLTDLSGAMQEQAALHLHYASVAAAASRQVNDLKLGLEVAESKVYRQLRDKYVEEKVKITEALLDKEVAVHPTVIAFKRAVNEAKQIEAIAKGAVESFQQRKDMLVQHGARDRVEMQGELRMSAGVVRDENQAATEDRIRTRLAAIRKDA